jgi:hypothetical protein
MHSEQVVLRTILRSLVARPAVAGWHCSRQTAPRWRNVKAHLQRSQLSLLHFPEHQKAREITASILFELGSSGKTRSRRERNHEGAHCLLRVGSLAEAISLHHRTKTGIKQKPRKWYPVWESRARGLARSTARVGVQRHRSICRRGHAELIDLRVLQRDLLRAI